jgi:hypothetical protein
VSQAAHDRDGDRRRRGRPVRGDRRQAAGAEQTILTGSSKDCTDLGCDIGATEVIAERGEEAGRTRAPLAGSLNSLITGSAGAVVRRAWLARGSRRRKDLTA